ncbi:hypothetical protein AURDEDRAFT_167637 [Auricularia subglabra TFB-10046 SS5]|nr:hypothetical protein AURDEDRAFT_167637 [Auricularia subglabra TFB-10046 SS5]
MAENPGEPKSASIASTIGYLELSMAVSMFLSGVSTLQAWNYFRRFTQDMRRIKILVIVVYVLDAFHSILLIHSTYDYTILHFGDFEALEVVVWSMEYSVLLNGVIAFITYYCLRIYRLTSSRLIAGGCYLLVCLRVAFTVVEWVTLERSGLWAIVKTPTFRWQLSTMLVVGAVSDVAVAAAICITLLRMRTGFKATDMLVDKIVTFTVGSGLLSSIAAVTECATYLGFTELVFLVPYGFVAKLFTNSLLASLNERPSHRRDPTPLNFSVRSARSVVPVYESEADLKADSSDGPRHATIDISAA